MDYLIKNIVKSCFFIVLFCFNALCGVSQSDTLIIKAKIDEARTLFSEDPKKALSIAFDAYTLSKNTDNKKLSAFALNTIGSAYYYSVRPDSAEEYHRKALSIQEDIGDELGIGRSLTNIGTIYIDKGLNDKAIGYFLQAEKKFIHTKYDLGLSKLYNSMGSLFYNINDFNNSIIYYKKGIELSEKLHDDFLNYSLKINLGNVYSSLKRDKEALNLYLEIYSKAKTDSNSSYLVMICNNLCQQYLTLNNAERAKFYSDEAMTTIKNHEPENYVKITTFSNYAAILFNDKKYKESVAYIDSALALLTETPDMSKEIALKQQLSKVLFEIGDYNRSFSTLLNAFDIKDSLYKKNLDEKLSEINTIHEVEKKEGQILSLHKTQKEQQLINYLLLGVAFASLISIIILITGYRRKKRDNETIRMQKNEVLAKNTIIEEKQKEIIGSITYAKRIQESIMPAETYWQKHLPASFIFYKPKDIVAGDFYWMETSGHLLFFAVADCTGHGVPGAIISVVCCNSLNRTLLEFKITDPGKLLDKTKELVLETFSKSGEEIKDGMDISLCCLNTLTHELQWAGANNPLWIVQNKVLTELKADKQPIGKYSVEVPFNTHSIQLQKEDVLYIFTDGFADQFGGTKGKKYKYKPLAELLKTISHETMLFQKQTLHTTFENWKGELEQVDDVTIIGIKI